MGVAKEKRKQARIRIVRKQRDELPVKSEMISMRLTESELKKLDFYKAVLEERMGLPVTRGWVIKRLLELGTPTFEKFYDLQALLKEIDEVEI